MRDDLRHAVLALVRRPAHSLLALLTLSCGLGFAIYAAAIYIAFSVGDIPFPQADRLVAIEATRDGDRTQANSVHILDLQEYQAQTPSLEGLHGLRIGQVTVGGSQPYPASFKAAWVPAAVWPWLGEAARPLLGRQLQVSDSAPGATPVLVLGEQLWRSLLGADPQAVGRRLKVNGIDTEIVGVAPDALRFPMTQQLWLPLQPLNAPNGRGTGFSMGTPQHVLALGRLKPGASRAQAQQELSLVAARIAQAFPKSHQRVGVIALPYAHWGLADLDIIQIALSLAATLLLVLAGVNTANLLLARANERRQELAVRSAMGAPRLRLVAQMLSETALLCLLAAGIGMFLSAWALEATGLAVQATADGRLPFWVQFKLHPQALLAALAITALTALATGLLPAWRASSLDLASALRDGRGALGRASGRFARGLVFVQIALSSLLLLAAGLQAYAVHSRLNAGTGARMDDVMTARLIPRLAQYRGEAGAAARAELWQRLEGRLQEAAQGAGAQLALSSSLPGGGMRETEELLTEGMSVTDDQYPEAGLYRINAGFFKALDVKLLSGREFGKQDRADGLPVAIINQNLAARYWPGQDPLGKRLMLNPAKRHEAGQPLEKNAGQWLTVVGVIPHVLQGIGREEAMRAANVYVPIAQSDPYDLGIAVAGVPDTPQSRELMARAVALSDPALALEQVFSAHERQRIAHGGEEVMAAFCLALGLLTLVLASSGIYAVTSRAVLMRTQEIGVRRAVGATDAQMMRLLLGQALLLLLLALPLGLLGGCLLMSDALGALLPMGLGAGLVGSLIAVLVLFSTWLPTRRALRQLPSQALNSL